MISKYKLHFELFLFKIDVGSMHQLNTKYMKQKRTKQKF